MGDDNALSYQHWGYFEAPIKGQLNLQLSPGVERDTKPFLSGRDSALLLNPNGAFRHRDYGVSETQVPMDFSNGWMNQRDKFLHVPSGNPNFAVLSETSSTQEFHMLHQPLDPPKDERLVQMEEPGSKKDGPLKKRLTPKSPKPKKPKKPKDETIPSVQRSKPGRQQNTGLVINGIDMDIMGIPTPVCSCTGIAQQCYRWGCGGWQSACCTTSLSMYPLPMSTKRRGARIAGRKMSQGAFKKVLEKLAAEGYNLSNPIDLRTHWAKHGTNKFVTIR
ncbi:GAGA-binding transcriptional activator [Macleaya cordata]|uniref:GAGA-binding transcriptional activator n=1 Tax=Macleaya cordata TaxID=56857 RepID=A0A200PYF4_MACCD|nr:GAGA-binding transcriptional activator [Macleaya cordata]